HAEQRRGADPLLRHRAPGRHRPRQHDSVDEGRRREDRLQRQGHARRLEPGRLSLALLQLAVVPAMTAIRLSAAAGSRHAALRSVIPHSVPAEPARRAWRTAIVLVTLALAVPAAALFSPTASAERIKDIATVAGVRGNQLGGYGLVVGLDGTGDQTSQTPFTIQALKNMLAQLGVLVPENVNPQLRNVAAVTVQATLPPFA